MRRLLPLLTSCIIALPSHAEVAGSDAKRSNKPAAPAPAGQKVASEPLEGGTAKKAAKKKSAKAKAKAKDTAEAKPTPAPTEPPAESQEAAQPSAEAAPEAEPTPAQQRVDFRLVEIFNVEQLPGLGKLTYTAGDKAEELVFGETSGYYAIGVMMKGARLPEPYAKDFSKNEILQIAMGSMRSRLQGQIPQFAALSAILSKVPTGRTKVPLITPEGGEKKLKAMAFLIFTAPQTPADRSDEDKLKSTYFSQKGSLELSPKGEPRVLELKAQGQRFTFKLQMMKTVVDATLVTPFNATPASLKGTVQIPVYSPHNAEAVRLTQRIFGESMESPANLISPEGIVDHPRDVAGSQKK